jgi:hypothetical protein
MPVPSPDKSGGSTTYQKLGINNNAMAFYFVGVTYFVKNCSSVVHIDNQNKY